MSMTLISSPSRVIRQGERRLAESSFRSSARVTSEAETRRTCQPGSGSTTPWLISPHSAFSESVVDVGVVVIMMVMVVVVIAAVIVSA